MIQYRLFFIGDESGCQARDVTWSGGLVLSEEDCEEPATFLLESADGEQFNICASHRDLAKRKGWAR